MRPRYSTPPRKVGDLERVEYRVNVFIHFCVTYKSKSSNSNPRLMDIVHVSDTMLLIYVLFFSPRLSHHFLLWFDLFLLDFQLVYFTVNVLDMSRIYLRISSGEWLKPLYLSLFMMYNYNKGGTSSRSKPYLALEKTSSNWTTSGFDISIQSAIVCSSETIHRMHGGSK